MSGVIAMIGIVGGGLTVSITPPNSATGGTSGTFTTPSLSGIPAGGSGSYSYAWAIIAHDGQHGFNVVSPTSSATTIQITSISPSDGTFATIRLVVTDTVSGAMAFADAEIFHQDSRTL